MNGKYFSSSNIGKALLFLCTIFVPIFSFFPLYCTRQRSVCTHSVLKKSNDSNDEIDDDDDWLDDTSSGDYSRTNSPSTSRMPGYIEAFLEKDNKEEEKYHYTHMIGAPLTNCHQLQIELESVQKGVLYNCPILSDSCITADKSRMPLLYVDASGKPPGEVTDELYSLVNELVMKHCYVKEEYTGDMDDYSGINKDGYRPLTMTFHKLQIDGKKHEVLYTVADEDKNGGLSKLRSLVVDMEKEIQIRGWKTIWPSTSEVQGDEAKAYLANKYFPRIPIMRLPKNFEFEDDIWDHRLGSDGISPILWYNWKDDVLGRHVRLQEIGIYCSRSCENDISERNFYLPHETVSLPDGNKKLTEQERIHQNYQGEKMDKRNSRVNDNDNRFDDIMDPALSDNRKILENMYGKEFDVPNTGNSKLRVETDNKIMDPIEPRANDNPDENPDENQILDSVIEDSNKSRDEQSMDDMKSMQERFSDFMKQRKEDFEKGDKRPIKEWLKNPEYKTLYGDLFPSDKDNTKSIFESMFEKGLGFRNKIPKVKKDNDLLEAFEKKFYSKGENGKSMQDNIRDLLRKRMNDRDKGDNRPYEDWLEDPENQKIYNRMIKPGVSESRKNLEAAYGMDLKSMMSFDSGKVRNKNISQKESGIQDDAAIVNESSAAATNDKTEKRMMGDGMQDDATILEVETSIAYDDKTEGINTDEGVKDDTTIVDIKKSVASSGKTEKKITGYFPEPVFNGTHLVYDESKISRMEQIRLLRQQHMEKISKRKARPIEEWMNDTKYEEEKTKKKARKDEMASREPPFPSEEALMGSWQICNSPFTNPLDIPDETKCDNFVFSSNGKIFGGPVLLETKDQKASGGSWKMMEMQNKTMMEIRLFLPRKEKFYMVWRGEVFKGVEGVEERVTNIRDILEASLLKTGSKDIKAKYTEEPEEVIKCKGEVWIEDTETQKDRENLGPFLMIKKHSLDEDNLVYFIGDKMSRRY